jgi:hypothetical protein
VQLPFLAFKNPKAVHERWRSWSNDWTWNVEKGGPMNSSEAETIDEHFTPSIETAKVMIKDYFQQHHGQVIDYADLMNILALPLVLIVDACEALEREGKIAGVD